MQLKELQRKRRQTSKVQESASPQSEGIIKRIFPGEAYGFIATPQGQEIYFHENALKDLTLDDLAEGDSVKFGEGDGDKGPCAIWVKVIR